MRSTYLPPPSPKKKPINTELRGNKSPYMADPSHRTPSDTGLRCNCEDYPCCGH